jgi:undecaprenyl-diphosphatase
VTPLQALFLGLLQGASELFPVSSLGHAIVVPTLLRWSYRPTDPTFLPFLVLLHLGTATALVVLYRREWWTIVSAFVRAGLRGRVESPAERLAMLLVVGTIPAGLIGLVLQKPLTALFGSPRAAAAFLIVNGGVLFGAELLRRRDERRLALRGQPPAEREAAFAEIGDLSFKAALLVGLCQAFALLPGISRSGATMAGGLVAGLRHEHAVRFAFLLATPVIAAAGLLEVPKLLAHPGPLGAELGAAAAAGLAAYASARFLVHYFRIGRLWLFAWYSVVLGATSLVVLR